MSKVTLKIGDKFSSAILFENLVITEFVDSKIYMSDGKYWNIPLRQDDYYVNDVKYAKEDIIVPTVEEFEPITKDNIAEVLEYNGVKDAFSIDNNARIIVIGSGAPEWCSVNFKNPNWLQIIEAHLDKKLKPLPKKTNPFDAVKIGQWVRYVGEDAFETTKNRWYQRIPGGWFTYKTDNDSTVHATEYEEWDLIDIRDYNPDEEIILKVGDVYTNDAGRKYTIKAFDYIEGKVINGHGWRSFRDFNKENCIISVNGRQGKYVIPPFDFVQTLLDNGFHRVKDVGGDLVCNKDRYYNSTFWFDSRYNYINGVEIKPTPANAKRIIDAAKILNELE